jgi:ankyrin repeat protein
MAALHDWGDVIKEMIAIGFDAKRTSLERKVTALHEAASCGSQSALLALLETDADVNAENIDRQTPLLEAAEGNHPEAFLPLLEARANVHHQGWEKLTALHQVAMTGNDDAAKLLLEWKTEVNTCSGDGWGHRTPLHIAAERNHSAVAELLVDHGAVIDRACSQNYTPLLLAASSGCLEVVELLLKLKADLSIRTEAGECALHLAAANGHVEIAMLLFRHQPSLLKAVDNRKHTPLHSALQAREAKVSLQLLGMGSPVEAVDALGQTALHLATMHDLKEVVTALISEYEVDRTKRGLLGSPALHYAAQWGHAHLIEPLISNGGGDPETFNDDH